MAAVGRRVKQDIRWPALDPAVEHGFEGFVAGIVEIEGEIVAEYEKAMLCSACQGHKAGQAVDVLAMNFDELEREITGLAGMGRVDGGMRGFDERGFPHASRAPQKHVVGRKAL